MGANVTALLKAHSEAPFIGAVPPRGAVPGPSSSCEGDDCETGGAHLELDNDAEEEEGSAPKNVGAPASSSRCSSAQWKFAEKFAPSIKPNAPFKFYPPHPGHPGGDPGQYHLCPVILVDFFTTYGLNLPCGSTNHPCIYCSNQSVSREGFYSKGPRRVMDIDGCIYVWGRLLHCKDCGKYFLSYHKKVLERLNSDPRTAWVLQEFGIILTKKLGITVRLLDFLRCRIGVVGENDNFTSMANCISELHYLKYLRRRSMHAGAVAAQKSSGQQTFVRDKDGQAHCAGASCSEFGEIDDAEGYADKSPSAPYLTAVYIADANSRKHGEASRRLLVPVDEMLAVDFTFKFMQHVRIDGVKPLKGALTVTNSRNQVAMVKFYASASLKDAIPDLQKLDHQAEFLRSIPEAVIAGTRPYVIGSQHVKVGPFISEASIPSVATPEGCAPPEPATLQLRIQQFAATRGKIPGALLDFFSRQHQRVSYVYTDNCCHDSEILKNAFPHLRPKASDPADASLKPRTPLPQLASFNSVPVLYGKRSVSEWNRFI